MRFKDRGGRDMVLAMTHEEVVADLLRDLVKSYRQLPMIVYHFQTKFRDEPRARGGLIRVREFVMKDTYSLDPDEAAWIAATRLHYAAYERIFERLGLDAIVVGSRRGDHGRHAAAHEFMVLNEHGEDTLVLCERVRLRREPADGGGPASRSRAAEAPLPTEEVATPGTDTIASLAALLGVGEPTDRQGRLLRDRRRAPA